MISLMSIDYLRLSQLELDHHSNETLYCIFTLLDRTPFVKTNSDIGLSDAQEQLSNGINTHALQFHTDDGLFFEAVPDSLENIQYLWRYHAHDINLCASSNYESTFKSYH